jgi:hypothetical protein
VLIAGVAFQANQPGVSIYNTRDFSPHAWLTAKTQSQTQARNPPKARDPLRDL